MNRHPQVLPMAQRAISARQRARRRSRGARLRRYLPGHEWYHPQLHSRERPHHKADGDGDDTANLQLLGQAGADREAAAAALHGH